MGSRHTNPDLRSASFSEYLNQEVEDCACQLADSVPQDELPNPILPGKIGPGDRETDVFDAKKYFDTNSHRQVRRDKKENHVPARKLGTPNVISATCSSIGNPFPGSDSVDIQHRNKNDGGSRREGILSGFSCSGLCSDAKSVQASKESQIKKPSSDQILNKNPIRASVSRSERTGEFEFPALNTAEPAEEQPRKSLDVFGSDTMAIGGDAVAINLQRKMSILTWDAIPEARSLPVPPKTDTTRIEDAESCASSDLFEIESISAICRDGISRPAWSEAPPEKEIQKRSRSRRFSLLGCKNQKSVNVAEPGQETRPK